MTSDRRLVQAADDVGSAELAAALDERDPVLLERALQSGWVVVATTRADETRELRLFAGLDDARDGWELPLFSSSDALAAFLAGDSAREFDVRRGSDLAGFLVEQRGVISRVVFDPAGPHAVAAPVDDVIEALRPRADDDEVAWMSAGAAPPPRAAVIDFRWAMDLTRWDREVAADVEARHSRPGARLVKRVRRAAGGDAAAADWSAGTVREWARLPGAREVAAHIGVRGEAALAVLAVRAWQEGPIGPASEAGRALAGGIPGSVPFDAGGSVPGVRVLRRAEAPGLPLGVQLLDYWLPSPDGGGVCLARFGSPDAGREGDLLALCEPVVARGSWVERVSG